MVSSIPIQYQLFTNKPISSTYGTLTSTATHNLPGSNGNERVLHTPQYSRNGVSSPDVVWRSLHFLAGRDLTAMQRVHSVYSKPWQGTYREREKERERERKKEEPVQS